MSDLASERDPLNELAEEFTRRHRRGERPSLTEYAERYPELAEQIRNLFPALLLMEDFGSVSGPRGRAALPPAPFPQQLGEYHILREVGRGGMGVVYEAVQETLGRHVALKVLPFSRVVNLTQLERFRREARAVAKLHHSNIVPVFGIGEHEGTHYYAMQFIQGLGLDAVLEELRRLRGGPRDPARPPGPEVTVALTRGLLTGQFEGPAAETTPGPAARTPGSAARTSDLACQPLAQFYQSVARIGAQVAEALAYAHGQGVVHRDIKPSNLLLDTQGTVWVTDFGLAKADDSDELTSPGDIVGTLRYMAPERFQGQADPRSDVYGLGATLYELLTLHPAFEDTHRAGLVERITRDEPRLPRRLDAHVPRDLETIVLKAMAKEPARRYAGASELADDLRRFLADRPIRARRASLVERGWRWCRRNPALVGLAGSVTLLVLFLLVSIGSWAAAAWLRRERDRAVDELRAQHEAMRAEQERAERAEVKVREGRWNALLAHLAKAQVSRQSPLAGRRFDSLRALAKAAEVGRALEMPPERLLELRNEAIACLALTDLRVARRWEGAPSGSSVLAFDADLRRYARTDARGNVSVRRVADDREVCRLPGKGDPAWVVRFSPDGRFLAAKYHPPGRDDLNRFRVWDLDRRKAIFEAPPGVPWIACDFTPDGRRLAVGPRAGQLELYDLTSPKRPPRRLPTGEGVVTFAFHPDGRQLAVTCQNEVQVWGTDGGAVIRKLAHDGPVRGATWHPDGKLLAVTCDRDFSIHVWDAAAWEPRAVLKGHHGEVTGLAFSHSGHLLASTSWDGTLRLWDPWTGQHLVSVVRRGGCPPQFSRDDRLLAGDVEGTRVRLWEVAAGTECRAFHGHGGHKGPWGVDLSPDRRLMASAGNDGVRLWDLLAGKEVGLLPVGASDTALFHPDGRSLITRGSRGLHSWPIAPAPGTAGGALRVGPPRPLGRSVPGHLLSRACLTPDGRTLVTGARTGQVVVLDLGKQTERVLQGGPRNIASAAISPDGRWVAAGTWGGGGVRVWDTQTGRAREVLSADAYVGFSPEGRWLVAGTGKAYHFWETGSWRGAGTVPREYPGKVLAPPAFTRDGKMMAAATSSSPSLSPVRLLDPASGREFATLVLPQAEMVTWLCFSPDGGLLAAACSGKTVWVWDLGKIREQLAAMGLDWDLPPCPRAPPPAPRARPLSVQVVLLDARAVIDECDRALARDPKNYGAYARRGLARQWLGQDREAIRDFSAALEHFPARGPPPVRAQLFERRALSYLRLREHESALADLRKAVELAPDFASACNNLAWVYLTGPQKLRDPKKALPLAQKAVDLTRGGATYLNTLGVAQYRLGQYPQALGTLERSVREGRADTRGFDLFFLAMCHQRLGHADRARECYDRAVEWVREREGKLSAQWAEELKTFRAEAEELLRTAAKR
jgi:eukaryotic-like serine/threonine-protein kinase